MDSIGTSAGLNGTSWLFIAVFACAVLLICLSAFLPRMDPQEPPSIRPRIPFAGHIVELFRHQIHYFDMLNTKYALPIYTLPMLTGKTYVVTSPDLVQSTLRVRDDSLSVEPFMINIAVKNLNDQSPEAMKVWAHTPKGTNEPFLFQDTSKAFIKTLTPGAQLHHLNLAALDKFSDLLDEIRTPKEENLYLWLRQTFTIAVSTGLFGPHDPISLDPSLADAQWTMEASSFWIFIGLFSKFLFPTAFAARLAVQRAYGAYHVAGHDSHPNVSAVIKSTCDILRRYGLTDLDIGKVDVGTLHGATSNAGLVFFWLCVYIFADPKLKEEIRAELLAVTAEQQAKKIATGRREMVIDISRVPRACPLLQAVHQEVFRTKLFSLVTRFVSADTTVSDSHGTSYLLKAGSIVQIPTAVPQTSADVWGPDAHMFDARRFLKPTVGDKEALSDAKKEQEKLQKKAFFPFSNGMHKCPGRHFATAGHLGMMAMLILGYEITTIDGKAITIPQNAEAQRIVSNGAGKPSDEFAKLQVKVRRREGWEDVVWRFKVAEEK